MPVDPISSRRDLLGACGGAVSSALGASALAGCVGSDLRTPHADPTDCATDGPPHLSDWPMVGYDRRNTGSNPNAAGPRSSVGVRWTDGGHGFVRTTPVVADGTAFVHGHPNRLVAFDRETGSERWTLEMGASGDGTEVTHPRALSTPTVVGDTVYVGGGNFELDADGNRTTNHVHLYAVDRRTGEVRWTFQPDDYVHTAPVVVDGTALFATRTGTVYAVDTESRSVEWTVSVDGNPGPVVPTPALADCTLYLATPERGLHAIDVRSGERDWTLPEVRSLAAPAVADGTVYVAGHDGTLFAVSASDGSVEWEYETGGVVARCSPAIDSRVVFVGNTAGESETAARRMHAVDATTGERVWAAETGAYVKSSPAVADGVVSVGAGPAVLGFDAATGERLWSVETEGWTSTPLSVADGTVYGATADGQVYALAGDD